MQVNNSVLNVGSIHDAQKNALPKSVRIPGRNGEEDQELFLKSDMDTYHSSMLKECPREFKMIYGKDGTKRGYVDKTDAEQIWETAKQKYKDEPFKLYAQSQNLVFSQKLKESGFFDGMSEEEAGQFEELLADITAVMNGVNRYINIGRYASSAGVSWKYYTDTDVCGPLFAPPSYEAKGELESASAALRLFCDKYVDEENKEEFYALIDDFHAYNTDYLKDYETSSETMARSNELLLFYNAREQGDMAAEDVRRATLEYDIQKKQASDTYVKTLSAMFEKMRQTGVSQDELWKMMDSERDKCMKKTGRGPSWAGWEREQKNAQTLSAHMKRYWEKLTNSRI